MNFYKSFILFNIIMVVFSKNIVSKSGLGQVIPCSIGLQFYAEINNTSGEDCSVEIHPDECCLDTNDAKCNIVEVIGTAADNIPEGTSKTLQLIAPLLDPYDRKGFCTIYVDYKSKSRPKKFIRDTIKIKFDTTLRRLNLPADAKICKHVDEDPMNDCKPVHCDTHYNGKRSYYSLIKKRCFEIPTCLATESSELPFSAYNPVSNKCINRPAISKDDIDFIKALTGGKDRKAKDILIIKMMDNKNLSHTLSDPFNAQLDSDIVSRLKGVTNKLRTSTYVETPKPTCKIIKKPKKPESENCFVAYLSSNKYTLLVLTCVVILQCCLICTMVYCLTRNCSCCRKKKVIKKFFNYRQDASVTTPLICTSNIDTETTDYQYLSESSNYIEKKIKCYKACQKERKNNAKLSMSDDILSKCLTRRDWNRLPRSETIPEVRNDDESRERQKDIMEHRKSTDTKVNFQEEIREKRPKSTKSIVKKNEAKTGEQLSDSSEKVIRCHSYNYEGGSNMTGYKKSSHSKTFGLYKHDKKADSIEQGAQAYFSNDSIEDFLSERGVIFIGDNASKYSFTSISSGAKSTASSQSSKTSKNNVVKNVISLLTRKAKTPMSDPGLKKSKPDLDLELLHISQASMCSSSNESDICKDLKRIKESTSSL
uniref:Generative cell specific-1/HAP2 domain-containing protein n=1 Tax=Heliothis virescens TaxID=7102 RepID=A0A2A4JRH5_HELVI